MKSTTFYRVLLGLPYLFLIPGLITMRDYFRPMFTEVPEPSSDGLLQFIGAFWGVTGLFWLIPYTFFAIGLLLWSIGKTKEIVRAWFIRSPLILMILSPFFYLLLSPLLRFLSDKNELGAASGYIVIGIVCSAPLSLLFGFIFVGIGLVLHSILTSVGFIRDEALVT